MSKQIYEKNDNVNKVKLFILEGIKNTKRSKDDRLQTDFDGTFEFLKGYIRAIIDFNIVSNEDGKMLRDELVKVSGLTFWEISVLENEILQNI